MADWLEMRAPDYGFVRRFPESGTWHYRYVGALDAWRMTEAGLTLEEYLNPEGK